MSLGWFDVAMSLVKSWSDGLQTKHAYGCTHTLTDCVVLKGVHDGPSMGGFDVAMSLVKSWSDGLQTKHAYGCMHACASSMLTVGRRVEQYGRANVAHIVSHAIRSVWAYKSGDAFATITTVLLGDIATTRCQQLAADVETMLHHFSTLRNYNILHTMDMFTRLFLKFIPPKRRFGKEEQKMQSGFRRKHCSRA
jgi:hypothetical protein